MAARAARDIDVTLNAVAVEGWINNFSLGIEQETPAVTAFADQGPRVVVGNYNWNSEIAGPWDGAAGAIDATLWGLVGSTGVSYSAELTGTTGAVNAPEYTGTVVLGSYTIRGAVGQPITYQARLAGNSSLIRDAA